MICRKEKYRSASDADQAIKRIMKNPKRSGVSLRSYYCMYCTCYHLTKQPDYYMELKNEAEALKEQIKKLEKELMHVAGNTFNTGKRKPTEIERILRQRIKAQDKKIEQLQKDKDIILTQLHAKS